MPALRNVSREELERRKKEMKRERNRVNNERLKEARDMVFKSNPTKLITCTSCDKQKPLSDFYKSNIHVKFVNKKPAGVETGECKECAKNKQRLRDKAKLNKTA